MKNKKLEEIEGPLHFYNDYTFVTEISKKEKTYLFRNGKYITSFKSVSSGYKLVESLHEYEKSLIEMFLYEE